jgi:hypothetical protein
MEIFLKIIKNHKISGYQTIILDPYCQTILSGYLDYLAYQAHAVSGYLKNKVWHIGLCLIGVIRLSLTSPEFSEIIDT